ncbi:MAG: DMT family transporter [Gammaproteobacteria bacterium]
MKHAQTNLKRIYPWRGWLLAACLVTTSNAAAGLEYRAGREPWASSRALTLAQKRIDMSVAYAIWADVGMVLVAVVGVLWFKEQVLLSKVVSILIAAGVAGLHLSGTATEQ